MIAPIDLQMRLLAGLPDEAWAVLRERSDGLPGFKPLTVGDHRCLAELVGARFGYFELYEDDMVANESCTLMFLRVVLPALARKVRARALRTGCVHRGRRLGPGASGLPEEGGVVMGAQERIATMTREEFDALTQTDTPTLAIGVTCPTCGSEPGVPCFTRTGRCAQKPHRYRANDAYMAISDRLRS